MSGIVFARPFIAEEEEALVLEVLRSGWIVGGAKVQAFEEAVAREANRAGAVAVSSWTTGAFLVLHAWGIGAGDEVLVPSLTFIASVNVIRHVGATPVFVEIDPLTYNIDPIDCARKVTSRTRAILPVDQIGLPCDIAPLLELAQRNDLKVLADTACSLGARRHGRPAGMDGDVAVFSTHARKVVTTGEGGMIVSDDVPFLTRLRRLRQQGMSLSDFQRHKATPTTFETYDEVGFNFRMTDLQGAMGVAQMDRLPAMLEARRTVADVLTAGLRDDPLVAPPMVPEGMVPNWQSYQVSLRRGDEALRNAFMEALAIRGVPTRRGVHAAHLEKAYGLPRGSLPITERVAATTFQLPMHAGMTANDATQVLQAVRATSKELSRSL